MTKAIEMPIGAPSTDPVSGAIVWRAKTATDGQEGLSTRNLGRVLLAGRIVARPCQLP
jgi:hypothetical protein